MAVVWALEKARMFILGCQQLIVLTDHLPLVGILNDRALEGIANPCLLRLKERTLRFRFEIQHRSGNSHTSPDAISRYPVNMVNHNCNATQKFLESIRLDPSPEDIYRADCTENMVHMNAILSETDDTGPIIFIGAVAQAASNDTEYQSLLQFVRGGFPDSRHATPGPIRQHWPLREILHHYDGTVTMDNHIIIPRTLRVKVLDNLHSAHQGLTGMKARAKNTVWWPRINKDLEEFLQRCPHCRFMAKSQVKEPLCLTKPPDYPFQSVVADHFEYGGHQYLTIADRFTGWIEVFGTGSDSRLLIQSCKDLFTCFGVPETLSSDGGPAFHSHEFRNFLGV